MNKRFCVRGHRREPGAKCAACERIREAARRAGDLFTVVEEQFYRLGIVARPMREHGLSELQLAESYQ